MRYWQVWVKAGDGRHFHTKAVVISAERAVLRGAHSLPTGMVCDLQIVIPPHEKQVRDAVSLQAQLDEVIFSSGEIRLEFRIKSLSDEVRQLIDSRLNFQLGQIPRV